MQLGDQYILWSSVLYSVQVKFSRALTLCERAAYFSLFNLSPFYKAFFFLLSFVLDEKIVSSKISENSDRNEEENPRATGGVGCLRQGGRLSQGLGSRVDAVIGAAGLLHADAGRRGIRRAGDGRLGRGAGGELAARRTRSFGVVGGAELTLPVSSLPDAQAAASDDSSDESARKTRRKAVVERSDESAMLTDDAALFFFSLLMFSTLVLTPFRLGKDFGLELSASERMAGAARSSAVRCRECATSRRRDVPVRPCLWRRGARRRERLQCTCRLTKTHDDRRQKRMTTDDVSNVLNVFNIKLNTSSFRGE